MFIGKALDQRSVWMSAYRCEPLAGATEANPSRRGELLHSPRVFSKGVLCSGTERCPPGFLNAAWMSGFGSCKPSWLDSKP